jgi:cytochrome c biogenesis protein CcmG/thiol:disulfide interchange protein DsbE
MPGVVGLPPAISESAYGANRTKRIVIKELLGPEKHRAIGRVAAAMALLGLAIVGCGSSPPEGGAHPDYEKALAGSPPRLATLHDQANRLLDGGIDAYEQRIEELRGYPVVANVWASWCGPCRFEFPAFQQVGAQYGKRVAFLGVDSQDADAAAETFLRDHPVPYPSYTDPDEEIADSIAGRGLPATAFYDRDGKLVYFTYVPYESAAELRADVERYALGGRAESG